MRLAPEEEDTVRLTAILVCGALVGCTTPQAIGSRDPKTRREEALSLAEDQSALPPICLASDDRVTQLVSELGSDEWATREAAQTELLRLGPPVVERLREAAHGPDPEVAARASSILDELSWTAPGEAVEGLQASLRILPGPSIEFRLQNMGEKRIVVNLHWINKGWYLRESDLFLDRPNRLWVNATLWTDQIAICDVDPSFVPYEENDQYMVLEENLGGIDAPTKVETLYPGASLSANVSLAGWVEWARAKGVSGPIEARGQCYVRSLYDDCWVGNLRSNPVTIEVR